MDESKKALIAEVQEITGKGRGEQPLEMPLGKLTREVGQVSTGRGRMELGSPGWEYMNCPSCTAGLKYYVPPYYPYPPYGPLNCPECGADLGVMGMMVEVVTPVPPPPIYTCPHCGAPFGSQAERDDHIASVHPPPPPPPPPGFKLIDWLKTYWPHLTAGGLSIALAGALIAKYAKKK